MFPKIQIFDNIKIQILTLPEIRISSNIKNLTVFSEIQIFSNIKIWISENTKKKNLYYQKLPFVFLKIWISGILNKKNHFLVSKPTSVRDYLRRRCSMIFCNLQRRQSWLHSPLCDLLSVLLSWVGSRSPIVKHRGGRGKGYRRGMSGKGDSGHREQHRFGNRKGDRCGFNEGRNREREPVSGVYSF